MVVYVNGEARQLQAAVTLQELVQQFELDPWGRGIAVAVDAVVVPRGSWSQVVLAPGAKVEILTAIQGG